jgi:hypothetical protein
MIVKEIEGKGGKRLIIDENERGEVSFAIYGPRAEQPRASVVFESEDACEIGRFLAGNYGEDEFARKIIAEL